MKPSTLLLLSLALADVIGPAPLAGSPTDPPPPSAPLHTIEAVQQLPLAMARLGVPVRLDGVVLFHDAEESLLVLANEDGTAQIIVETGRGDLSLAPGQRVGVEGATGFFLGNQAVTSATIRLLPGTRPLVPQPAALDEIVQGKHNHRYVEFEAVVTMLRNVRGRGSLHVHGIGGQVNVVLRDLDAKDPSLPNYQDALIRVRGVVVPYGRSAEGPRDYRLVASRRAEIEILETAPEHPFEVTATTLQDVPPFTTCCRIRVQGRVVQTLSGTALSLEDQTGRLDVQLRTPAELRPGDWADVVGYPTLKETQGALEHGLARLLAPALTPLPAEHGPSTVPPLVPALREIADVLKLSPAEAARGLPVRLRGQLAYHLPGRHLYLRTGKWGIEASLPPGLVTVPEDLRPGQILELDARTTAGEFNPKLAATQLMVLGEGSLPPAAEFRHGALASGQHDGNWVGVRGVVRAARRDGPSVALEVATAGGRFTAVIPADTNAPALLGLVDAGVYVRGICQVIANPRRQAIGFRLLVPGPVDLTIQKPPPSDPFSLPLHQVVNLFRYNPDVLPGHRVRVRGIVTLQRRAESFWLRDESGGIGVRLPKPELLEPGEILEVVGFPSLLDNRPYIHDPLIRRVGKTNQPAPMALSPRQALEGNHSGEWVSMTGRVLEVLDKNESPSLVLESDQQIFQAVYTPTNPPASFRKLQTGDSVRVNGVCLVKLDEEGVPRSFQVLADSPAQIEMVRRAPWLNPRRALLAALLLSAVLLAAAAWAILLRRQVRKQTRVIRDLNANLERRVAERTSELEAANRELESFSYSVSHDLRGPLRAVNGFAEILLQTHAGQLDERGSRYLRQVAEGGRRMGRLVDDLLTFSRLGRQPVNRARVDLHLLARRAVDELQRQHPQRQVEVILHPLPPALGDRPLLEQVLLNLLGNAWKFTARQPAARIEVGASAQGGQPLYFVRDNGAGFDMKYADKLFGVFQRLHPEDEFPGTGVGLAIVQRILQRHGGHIWAQASPGQGATFYFTLPSGAPAPAAEPAQAFGK